MEADFRKLLDNRDMFPDIRFTFPEEGQHKKKKDNDDNNNNNNSDKKKNKQNNNTSNHTTNTDRIIYAHKAILCARCEYFLIMFTRIGMKESQEGNVEIREHKYKIFKLFLEYIYTSQIRILPSQSPSFLQLYVSICIFS